MVVMKEKKKRERKEQHFIIGHAFALDAEQGGLSYEG